MIRKRSAREVKAFIDGMRYAAKHKFDPKAIEDATRLADVLLADRPIPLDNPEEDQR